MAEQQISHRKSCLVFSARLPIVNWSSRPVAKSAYFFSNTMISEGEIKNAKMSSFSSDFQCLYELLMSLRRLLEDGRSKKSNYLKEFVKKCLFQLSIKSPPKPPVRAGPKPTKQGFLDKLSGGKHKAPKWDNRYFELTETGYLYYYKKPDGGKPINSIYLRGCPVEIDQNDSCIIIVKSEERDWNLKAVNPGEASAWKDALSFYTDKQNWKKKIISASPGVWIRLTEVVVRNVSRWSFSSLVRTCIIYVHNYSN